MSDNPNMADMFGKIADMQRKMSEAQDALGSKTTTAEAGGGMVKVTVNGLQRVTSIKVDPDAVDPNDLELLEDLIIAGVNKALDEAASMARDEMSKATSSMLPPGFDMGQFGL